MQRSSLENPRRAQSKANNRSRRVLKNSCAKKKTPVTLWHLTIQTTHYKNDPSKRSMNLLPCHQNGTPKAPLALAVASLLTASAIAAAPAAAQGKETLTLEVVKVVAQKREESVF